MTALMTDVFVVKENWWSTNPGNSAYQIRLPDQKTGISISRQQNIIQRYGKHDVCRISLDVVKEKVWGPSKPNMPANEYDVKPKSGRPNPSRGNPSSSISSQQSNSPLISNGGNFNGNCNGSIILNKFVVIVKMVIK